MKQIKLFLILILMINCNQKKEQIDASEQSFPTPVVRTTNDIVLENFSYEDIARYTMSSIMGQPAKTIKVSKSEDLYYVSYIRKSDSRKFSYKIKFDGNKILWANIDGRWRNSEYDEKISFTEKNNKVSIIQTFSDNSEDIKEYKKGD
ncbi:hypothetical protein [Flavobacterium araucananum]|uniref:Uncharacterized protein n=1 Tax=Flavobacterium araucananum TaxID=946678 RepID=A0A227NPH9_9FLAO|nr:hypothetical protein [Flavobacterium araucananum]OXE99720.1 hypothetical protein B0A64_21045 [Flavobacterium araucananum]